MKPICYMSPGLATTSRVSRRVRTSHLLFTPMCTDGVCAKLALSAHGLVWLLLWFLHWVTALAVLALYCAGLATSAGAASGAELVWLTQCGTWLDSFLYGPACELHLHSAPVAGLAGLLQGG